jgi:hypothetical protein
VLASDALACVDITDGSACVDDHEITISSPSALASKRQELIAHTWPSSGFPTAASELVNSNAVSPIASLDNLERVEQLRTSMPRSVGYPVVVTTYHFIPDRKRERLAVVVQGHGCPKEPSALDKYFDDPTKRIVHALLRDGYSVMTIFMPLVSIPVDSTQQCTNDHAGLFTASMPGSSGMAYFLEPTAKSLNYAVQHYPSYRDFSMIGLSGGGWTTTVYAAIDTRIKISIPIAGSVPLYLRKNEYSHDKEQVYHDFYEIAGYPDLYILGSHGTGRQQIQVLNRHDECCFGAPTHDQTLPHVADKPPSQRDFESSVRLYETRVKAAVKALGSGSFRLNIEESTHTISEHALMSIVRPALNGRPLEPIMQYMNE